MPEKPSYVRSHTLTQGMCPKVEHYYYTRIYRVMRKCFTLLYFSKMVEHDIKEHHKIMMFLLKWMNFVNVRAKK